MAYANSTTKAECLNETNISVGVPLAYLTGWVKLSLGGVNQSNTSSNGVLSFILAKAVECGENDFKTGRKLIWKIEAILTTGWSGLLKTDEIRNQKSFLTMKSCCTLMRVMRKTEMNIIEMHLLSIEYRAGEVLRQRWYFMCLVGDRLMSFPGEKKTVVISIVLCRVFYRKKL